MKSYIESQKREVDRYKNEVKIDSTGYDKRAKDTFNFFKHILDKNMTILDVGCRDGRLLNILYKYGATNLFGVDLIEGNIERGNFSFLTGDMHELSKLYPNKLFNLIIATHVLEHAHNIKIVLDQIYQLLTPNGYVVFEVPLKREDKNGAWGHYINFKNENDFLKLLSKFNVVKKLVPEKKNWIRIMGVKK